MLTDDFCSLSSQPRGRLALSVLTILFAGFIFVPTSSNSQQAAKPDAKASPPPPQATTKTSEKPSPKPGEFYNKDLDLHFNYPIEMQMSDASALMESGHKFIYGVSGESDPEHQEVKRCTRFLLSADLPEDKAPQRVADIEDVWVDDSKEYKESRKPVPIFATIVMLELLRECLPKDAQADKDDILAGIAKDSVSEPGIQLMGKPLWYEVGKQNIHMNAGVGRPIANGELSPAPIIVMSMATEWRGHFLAWVFTSDDTEIFNEITKSQVQFGDGAWGAMYPATIGPHGMPMAIAPD
jgi:hypothetical protein